MFNCNLFFTLFAICLPGILVSVPQTVRTMRAVAQEQGTAAGSLPPTPVLTVVSGLQTALLIAAAAAVGTLATERAGLGAPFFEALVYGGKIGRVLRSQLVAGLVVGLAGAVPFILAYYRLFRPRLDRRTITCMEALRQGLGLKGRVLFGGICEEVLTRWGLMNGLAWLGATLAGQASAPVLWGAIIVSGILFGLGHLPSHLAAGCRRSPPFLAMVLFMNLWASLIFGWLFWQEGLVAAMLAHAVFHLAWWPVERLYRDEKKQYYL